jgi:hypothetical protein
LKDKHKKVDPALRELEQENERLKRIVAKQAPEIEVKSELLNNSYLLTRTASFFDHNLPEYSGHLKYTKKEHKG